MYRHLEQCNMAHLGRGRSGSPSESRTTINSTNNLPPGSGGGGGPPLTRRGTQIPLKLDETQRGGAGGGEGSMFPSISSPRTHQQQKACGTPIRAGSKASQSHESRKFTVTTPRSARSYISPAQQQKLDLEAATQKLKKNTTHTESSGVQVVGGRYGKNNNTVGGAKEEGSGAVIPRFMLPAKEPRSDSDGYKQRIQAVEKARHLPKPPILRQASIFMDPSYRRVVRLKKKLLMKQQLTAARLVAFKEVGDQRGEKAGEEGGPQVGGGVGGTLLRGGDDECDDDLGEYREEEQLRLRQEQWFILLAHASFLQLHDQVAEIVAMGVLRRLFVPILRKRVLLARRRLREKMLVSTFRNEIPELNTDQLKQLPPFVGWSDHDLNTVRIKFRCQASTPGTNILGQGSTNRAICILSSGVVQPSWSDMGVGKYSTPARKLPTLKEGDCFGDYAILMKEANPLTYSVGHVRVFYWRLGEEDYNMIAEDQQQPSCFEFRESLLRSRKLLTTQIYPLTPHCMQNCGRNRLFQLWSHRELEELIPLFEPAAFEAGEVIYDEGEVPNSFIVVCKGLLDVLRVDHSQHLLETTTTTAAVAPPSSSSSSVQRRSTVGASALARAARHRAPTKDGVAEEQVRLATFGPWQCVGDEEVITGSKRVASVVARTHVDCWWIDRSVYLDGLMKTNAKLVLAMKEAIVSITVSRLAEDEKVPAGYLARDPALKGSPGDFIASLAKKGEMQSYARRDTIWKGKHELCPVIVVLSGSVSFRASHRTTINLPSSVHDGSVIGLAAALENEPWPYSAALEGGSAVVAWVIPAAKVQQALLEWDQLNGTTVTALVKQQASALTKTHAVFVPRESTSSSGLKTDKGVVEKE